MTEHNSKNLLSADVPIEKIDEDSFAFTTQAKAISDHILESFKLGDSLVFGINGPWGSGKTSLINLTLYYLEQQNYTKEHIVLKFSPWIIGNHESILAKFLPSLEEKIRMNGLDRKQTETLRTYAKYVTKAIHGLNHASNNLDWSNLNFIGCFIKISSFIVSCFSDDKSNRSLEDTKKEVINQLNEHETPVLVVLDDIDRLEPKEILNILRLVRSTANLPYIVYLLSYDHDKVARMLSKELSIDGKHYLEKIIQLPIKVPEVSPVILSENLKKKLNKLFSIDKLSSERKKRFNLVADTLFQAGLASYPRDISRLKNIIGFRWRLSEQKVDPADATFVWALEMKYSSLHQWIQNYVRTYYPFVSSIPFRDPEHVTKERRRFMSKLIHLCETDYIPLDDIVLMLEGTLPGIERQITVSEDMDENESRYMFKLFHPLDEKKIFENRKTKRLASDLHWRNYFSYHDGSTEQSLEKIGALITLATENPKRAVEEFLRASKIQLPSGGTEAERIIEVIESMAENDDMSETDRLNVFTIIIHSIDVAADTGVDKRNKEYVLFWKTHSLSIKLLKPIASNNRSEAMFRALDASESVSWILFFIRNILKAHGNRHFGQDVDEPNWLNEHELAGLRELARSIICRLISDKAFIYKIFEPKWVFYMWHDLSDTVEKSEMRRWIEEAIKDDFYLLKFVKIFSTIQSSSSHGDRWSATLSDLRIFIDVDKATERINMISSEPGNLQAEATELKAHIEVAKDW